MEAHNSGPPRKEHLIIDKIGAASHSYLEVGLGDTDVDDAPCDCTLFKIESMRYISHHGVGRHTDLSVWIAVQLSKNCGLDFSQ